MIQSHSERVEHIALWCAGCRPSDHDGGGARQEHNQVLLLQCDWEAKRFPVKALRTLEVGDA